MTFARHSLVSLAVAAALAPAAAIARGPLDVRLNEVQVLGSHNSYHIQPAARILAALGLFDPALPLSLEYTHVPLGDQFELQGIRQIELDVFADPAGGLYANRGAFIFFGEDPASGLPELDDPGLKVLHVQDVDFDTTCLTFVGCLEAVKAWSDGHPQHLPIMILVEAKDDPIPDPFNLGFAIPVPFGPAELDAIDVEIRTVLPEDRLITPDSVRGTRATLEEAIRRDGWPTLRAARGKVLFALDNGGSVRDAYVAGHPALAGRVLFTDSPPGSPEAAFFKRNGPVGAEAQIQALVAQGYIVRTRADADTVQARTGDTTQREAALASGAQFVSTDYPVPSPFGTGYVVAIPGGSPARCNPVSAPRDCLSAVLENLTGFQAVAGKKLAVRDKDPLASRRAIVALAEDPLIETPLPGTLDDPATAGAMLALTNPTTGETAEFFLPPGGNWTGLGKPAGVRGYRYRDLRGTHGPCKLVVARRGQMLLARCSARHGVIPFTLDEPSQGSLAVTFQLGGGLTYCASFGGDVRKDTPAVAGGLGVFLARNAPRGACPLPNP